MCSLMADASSLHASCASPGSFPGPPDSLLEPQPQQARRQTCAQAFNRKLRVTCQCDRDCKRRKGG